jgi:hypothetical protein
MHFFSFIPFVHSDPDDYYDRPNRFQVVLQNVNDALAQSYLGIHKIVGATISFVLFHKFFGAFRLFSQIPSWILSASTTLVCVELVCCIFPLLRNKIRSAIEKVTLRFVGTLDRARTTFTVYSILAWVLIILASLHTSEKLYRLLCPKDDDDIELQGEPEDGRTGSDDDFVDLSEALRTVGEWSSIGFLAATAISPFFKSRKQVDNFIRYAQAATAATALLSYASAQIKGLPVKVPFSHALAAPVVLESATSKPIIVKSRILATFSRLPSYTTFTDGASTLLTIGSQTFKDCVIVAKRTGYEVRSLFSGCTTDKVIVNEEEIAPEQVEGFLSRIDPRLARFLVLGGATAFVALLLYVSHKITVKYFSGRRVVRRENNSDPVKRKAFLDEVRRLPVGRGHSRLKQILVERLEAKDTVNLYDCLAFKICALSSLLAKPEYTVLESSNEGSLRKLYNKINRLYLALRAEGKRANQQKGRKKARLAKLFSYTLKNPDQYFNSSRSDEQRIPEYTYDTFVKSDYLADVISADEMKLLKDKGNWWALSTDDDEAPYYDPDLELLREDLVDRRIRELDEAKKVRKVKDKKQPHKTDTSATVVAKNAEESFSKLESAQPHSRDTDHKYFEKTIARISATNSGCCVKMGNLLVTCAHVLSRDLQERPLQLTTDPISLHVDGRTIIIKKEWYVDFERDVAWCDASDLPLKSVKLRKSYSQLPTHTGIYVFKKRDDKYLTAMGQADLDKEHHVYYHTASTMSGDSGSLVCDSTNGVLGIHRGATGDKNVVTPLVADYFAAFMKKNKPSKVTPNTCKNF